MITHTPAGDIVWTRHEQPSAKLTYRGHLRFLQGVALRDLFSPLLLLRGVPGPVWSIPFEIHNVVFAEVHEAPKDLSLDQITMELLKIVLVPAQVS
jgi:hypothetical protein